MVHERGVGKWRPTWWSIQIDQLHILNAHNIVGVFRVGWTGSEEGGRELPALSQGILLINSAPYTGHPTGHGFLSQGPSIWIPTGLYSPS